MVVENARRFTYLGLFAALFLSYLILRDSTWQSSAQLHTVMEAVATFLALLVGVMALVRFYSKKINIFLFIGAGFLEWSRTITAYLQTWRRWSLRQERQGK